MDEAMLELRVLMGLQAGARLRLADGRYVLGSAASADVILAGPRTQGEHAALVVAGGQASIVALAGTVRMEDGTRVSGETALKPGQLVDCDGVWICVDRPRSAWPDLDALIGGKTSARSHAPAAASAGESTVTPSPAPQPHARTASSAVARMREGSRMPAATAVGVALAVLACLALAWAWLVAPSHTPPTSGEPSKTVDVAAAIRDRVKALGLENRIAIQRGGSGWTVTGMVADEPARDALVSALAALRPRPSVKVVTDEETYAAAVPLIARAALPARLEAIAPGRARLTVAAPTAEAAERLAQSLREELGGLRELETRILTPDKLVPALQEMTDRAGLGEKVRIASADRTSANLTATGTVNRSEFERWNRVLVEFRDQYGSLAAVRVALTQLAPPLPFKVRSVIGGDAPHVITAEGERVFAGGSIRGYRLVEIRDRELVFQGAERIVVPRPREEPLERRNPTR